jgi:hypothetical protein
MPSSKKTRREAKLRSEAVDERPGDERPVRVFGIYHRVFATENFEDAATKIWQLLRRAQDLCPGAPRHLYLDIEGHRNSKGGFDEDMYELQTNFLLGAIGRYIEAAHMPLASVRMPAPQSNDMPDELRISPQRPADR